MCMKVMNVNLNFLKIPSLKPSNIVSKNRIIRMEVILPSNLRIILILLEYYSQERIFSSYKYQIIFKLDHSQSYNCFIKDTLKASNFNYSFGGAVNVIWDCNIYSNTLLGEYEYNNKFKGGDIERHIFLLSDLLLYNTLDTLQYNTMIKKKKRSLEK